MFDAVGVRAGCRITLLLLSVDSAGHETHGTAHLVSFCGAKHTDACVVGRGRCFASLNSTGEAKVEWE